MMRTVDMATLIKEYPDEDARRDILEANGYYDVTRGPDEYEWWRDEESWDVPEAVRCDLVGYDPRDWTLMAQSFTGLADPHAALGADCIDLDSSTPTVEPIIIPDGM